MKMPSFKLRKKLVAIWSLFSLFVNMAQPAIIAYAVEAPSPEPTVEPSIESSPEPTIEPSALPIESTDPSPSPTPTPDATVEPSPSLEPSPSPTLAPSPAATEIPRSPEPTLDSSPAPPSATPTPDLNEELNISLIEHTLASTIEEFDLTVSESGSATLATDKADYAPTDTALITGSGFLSSTTYTLTISSTDDPATTTTVDVTTDAEGTLFYAYQLDGIYRPNYKVEAYLSGTLVATITFTDSPIPAFTWPTTWNDYLVNGLAIYDDEKIGGHADPSSGGTAVSPESIDIASGAVFSGTNPGNQPSVQLRTDLDPNYIFYRIRLADDPFATSGGSSRHWDVLLDIDGDGYKEYVIDMDNNGDVFGVYYNNDNSNVYDPLTDDVWTVIDPITEGYVRSVPEDYGTVSTGDDQYYIDFAVPTLTFGSDLSAVLASEAVFYSTSASNTDPLQKDYMGFSGFIFGIDKETSLDGSTWAETQTLTAGEEVYFKVTLTNTGNANLTDVSIVDTLPTGFVYVTGSTTGETTSNPSISGQVLTWSGPFTINADSSIELVFRATTPAVSIQTEFTNTAEAYFDTLTLLGTDTSLVVVDPGTGTLRVIKIVTTDNGGVASADDFSFQVNGDTTIGFEADGQNDLTVIPGTYTVTEPAFPGYSTSYDNCTSVEVTADNVTTCTITNDDQAPSLALVKEVITDNGGTAVSDDWTLTAEGYDTNSPQTGTYTLSESGGPEGYTQTSLTCDNANGQVTSVTLGLGEDVTCTFVNDDQPGTLIVNKTTIPTDTEATFSITATGSGVIQGLATRDINDGTPVEYTVDAGTYDVTESFLAGWSETGNDCNNVLVANGGQGRCTIENTKLGSISGFKWEDLDGDGFWDEDEPALANWFITLLQGSTEYDSQYTDEFGLFNFGDLLPDSYSLEEDLLIGWTQTASPSATVLGAGDVVEDQNFGNFENITITACKQADPDGILATETGRTNVAGWQVDLIKNGNTIDDTRVTGENGCYTWTDLGPGDYSVSEETQSGWTAIDSTAHDFGTVQSGETYSHTFVNTQNGSIVVTKQTDPDGSLQNFEFDSSYHNDNFLLTDGYSDPSGYLMPGTYSVSELTQEGWDLTSATCDDGSDPSSISLQAGEDISCTFTNSELPTLTVIKEVIVDNGGEKVVSDFPLFVDSDAVASGITNTYLPGDYVVSEDNDTGYSATISGDCDEEGNVSLSYGDDKTCTITNDDLPGTLVVTKVTLPESTSTLFSITATGSGVIQGDATQSVADGSPVTYTLDAGTYSVTELETDGWIETENDCTDVIVTNGNESSCTIENTKLGSVTVNKNVDTDGDGTVDVYGATDWLFELETKDYAMGTTVAVEPGTYTLSEFEESDYHFVSLFCDDVDQEGMNTELTVEPGQDIVCSYTNARDTGSITVNKVIDTDGDLETIEDQTLGANWAFSLDGEVEATTSGSGSLTFSDLVTDSYDLTELTEDGYDLVFATCGDENGDFDGDTVYSLEVEKDTITTCTFYNSPNGVLHGRKWLDIDGEGDLDELQNLLSGWTINLYLDGGEGYEFYDSFVTDDGDHLGWYWFEHLVPGDYKICEVNQPGYSQTYPEVNDGCYLVSLPDGTSSPSVNQELTNYVTGPAYDFGNIEDDPELTLTKTNDATGTQVPGSDVLYTLVLTLTGGILSDVTLTDTPPTGFTYRPGSWTATSNVRGDLSGLGEPTYASPGVWTLGNMIDGEVITLTYIADVSTSQDSGNYKDLAWAQGYSSQTTRILAVGSLDDNFAGTQVEILRSEQQTGTVNIETTGQVLGASTELPSTGASTHWLYLALGLLVSGLLLILGSRHLKKILLVFAFLIMNYSSTTPVQAATNGDPLLTVRMEAPTSPTRLSSWTLAFTTLDIDEREITVKCFVKKPAGVFAQFDTNKVLSGGGTGSCLVDSSVMNTQGSYEFYITATAGSGEDITDTAIVVYDTEGPGTPTSFSKEHPSECRYVIKFHTAADGGLTQKVEIYSSDSTNFDTHDGTRVGTVTIGSDANGEFTHVRGGDCTKTWYYVVRAFDSAGNQSGHIGDSVNSTTTITPSPSPTSALVVTESGSGSILGSEDLENEGEVMGQEDASVEESTNPDFGSQSLAKNKGFWWIVLILIALRILYGIVKKSSKD